jgi:thiol-disulfide isomerase/thioredoxin
MGLLSRFLRPAGGVPVDPTTLPVEGRAPEFAGITAWLNGGPLTVAGLAGKVVLVDFWTYSCVNCVRTLPYVQAWHEAYKDKGLVIVGVHTPEFDFEKDEANVRAALAKYGITYPVAMDNDYATWNAYSNHYWPAHYFVDAKGDVRYHHFGEGNYGHSEAVIKALLAEAGAAASGDVSGTIDAGVDFKKIGSPETYLGFDRLEYLGSPEAVRPGVVTKFTAPKTAALNVFYFSGAWELDKDCAMPREGGAAITYRVRAAKVHMVLSGGGETKKIRVTVDGRPLSANERGADVDADSVVTVNDGRMYDLVDGRGDYGEKLLELTFLDPDVKCYAFTFS